MFELALVGWMQDCNPNDANRAKLTDLLPSSFDDRVVHLHVTDLDHASTRARRRFNSLRLSNGVGQWLFAHDMFARVKRRDRYVAMTTWGENEDRVDVRISDEFCPVRTRTHLAR